MLFTHAGTLVLSRARPQSTVDASRQLPSVGTRTDAASRAALHMPKALDVIHKLAVSGLVTATLYGIYTCVDGTRHIVDARKKEAARMKAAGEAPKPPPKHEKYFS